jgi:AcrR family transcriptional regulator
MNRVNTRDRIKEAALPLFAERGFAATSIAAIETAAGLAPRAGAFYRHFPSKEALLEELARERITETPDEFDFEGLKSLGDTRAELISLARQFEIATERQRPYVRLIEETRLTDFGRSFEQRVSEAMLEALMSWVATKRAGAALDATSLAALTLNVFGSWLFFLTKRRHGIHLAAIDRDTLLDNWARRWSAFLDSGN